MSVEAKRKAKIELTAGTAGMDRGLADAKRKLRTFEREQARAASVADKAHAKAAEKSRKLWADRRGRALGALGHGIGMALGGDLVSQFTDAVHGIAEFERELTRFQIDAQMSGQQVAAFRDQVMAASEATGQSRLAILQGAHAYQVLTGDAKSAAHVSKLFAQVANASGASMDDIAATAASLHNNLGFKASDFRQGFDVLLSMGHKGNIELRQFGAEMNRLSPLIKDFGGGANMDKLAEMAASLEVAGPSFKGSRDEAAAAAEGVQQLLLTMRKPQVAERFSELGVKIWTIDPKTKRHVLRDWTDILGDIKKKVPDKMVLQAALGGRGQAFMALEGMVDNYDRLVQLKDEALGSDQVAKDNATWMQSTSGKIAFAWTHIKNSIAEALTPDRIEAFSNALVTSADAFATAIGAADEWFSSVGHYLFGGGGGQAAEENTGMQEMFLNNTVMPGVKNGATPQTEQAAIANAEDIIANPQKYAGTQWAHDYGGTKGLVDISRKYLESEGIKLWDAKGAGTVDTAKLDKFLSTMTPERMASAIAQALRTVGITANGRGNPGPEVHVKIGAEPVQKAAANAMEHRRGRNH